MNKLISAAILSSGLLLCGTAFAGDIPAAANGAAAVYPLKSGGMLKTADGHRVGFVDAIDTAQDGTPVSAQVIVDSRVVRVPASTITAVDKTHYTTSLSFKDVEHL